MLRRCAHRQHHAFDGGVAGTVAGPLHWRAGWQPGSLAKANCLECVLSLKRNDNLGLRFLIAMRTGKTRTADDSVRDVTGRFLRANNNGNFS